MTETRRLGRRAMACGGLLCLAAAVMSGSWVATSLIVTEPLPSPDGLVALASHEWERLPALARLARRHPAAAVMITVPPNPTQHNCFDCVDRVEWLEILGVEAGRTAEVQIRERGTWGEALVLLEHCRERQVKSLLIVTSPYHTRRSLDVFKYVFRESGIAVGVHPAPAEFGASPVGWWMHDYDRGYVLYEWAANAYYRTRMAMGE